MADNISPLTTEHLRIMRGDIAAFRSAVDARLDGVDKGIQSGFDDIRRRLTRVEHSVLGLKRDETDAATELAEHRHALDQLELVIRELRERLTTLENRAAH